MMPGDISVVGNAFDTAFCRESHSGVAIGLIDDISFISGVNSTSAASSGPMASVMKFCTSCGVSPGMVRTSMSMSTTSGIVFVFVGLTSTFGLKVMWQHECRWPPMPSGIDAMASSTDLGSSSMSTRSFSRPWFLPKSSICDRHSSWKRGGVLYSATRCTIAAALISALSAPYGRDPCPGVPLTRSRRQATPFSPTFMVTVGRFSEPPWRPPFSVNT